MKEIACSFCGKTVPNEKARGHVIAGPDVFICRGCAEICIGVFASYDPEWRDRQIARLANEGGSAKTETIYVWLPDEGVDVFRPVTAEPVQDDLYRLIDAQPDGEVWEFQQGDTVRCRRRQLSGEGGKTTDYLVAVEKAESPATERNLQSSLFVHILTSLQVCRVSLVCAGAASPLDL